MEIRPFLVLKEGPYFQDNTVLVNLLFSSTGFSLFIRGGEKLIASRHRTRSHDAKRQPLLSCNHFATCVQRELLGSLVVSIPSLLV